MTRDHHQLEEFQDQLRICYDCVNIILLKTVTLTICGVITTLTVSGAKAQEYKLNKTETPYSDLLDSFRLACKYFSLEK